MTDHLEALRKKRKLMESKSGGVFWKVPQGKSEIRILPPMKGRETFYEEALYHYEIGTHGFHCNTSVGKKCLICIRIKKWEESSSPRKNKLAALISPIERYYANIVNMKNTAAGVMVWSMPKSVLNELLSIFMDPDYEDITDVTNGFNLIVERTGEHKATRYTIRPRREPTPLKKRSWLKGRHNLFSQIKPYDREKVIEAFEVLAGGGKGSDE